MDGRIFQTAVNSPTDDLKELILDQADLLAMSLKPSGGFRHSGTTFTTGTLIVGLNSAHERFRKVVSSITQIKAFIRDGDYFNADDFHETINLAINQQPVLVAITRADLLPDETAQAFSKCISDMAEKKSAVQILLTTDKIANVPRLVRDNCSPAYLKEVVR